MGGWFKIGLTLRISQPSLGGVGAASELGNKKTCFKGKQQRKYWFWGRVDSPPHQ